MGLSQTSAAELLHITQPKISALVNYRLSGFSVERLIHFLNAFGRDVEIIIRKPRSGRTGKIQVTAA
jgi:predicted XRE-type DNA-binding protein